MNIKSKDNKIISKNIDKKVKIKKNLLFDKKPYLVNEFDFEKNKDIDINSITYGSNKKVWWKCKNNHSYKSRISNRTFLGQGCPYCSRQKLSIENCLAIKYPKLLKRTSGWPLSTSEYALLKFSI